MPHREEFDAAVAISGGHAGGYNPATSPRTIGFITDGNNMKYHVNDDGHLDLLQMVITCNIM
jgi:hypothetical protein